MKIKQPLLSLLFVILTFQFSTAQDYSMTSGKIGLSFSTLGTSEVVRFKKLDGAASFENKGFYSIGINYVRPISSHLEFETGFEYSHHDILVKPNLGPGQEGSSYNDSFAVINIPLTIRAQFLKYLFLNGGLIIGFDAGNSSPISSQTGIGALMGLGAQYQTNSPVGLFINPYLKAQTLIPFSMGGNHQRVLETGIRMGVSYVLN